MLIMSEEIWMMDTAVCLSLQAIIFQFLLQACMIKTVLNLRNVEPNALAFIYKYDLNKYILHK